MIHTHMRMAKCCITTVPAFLIYKTHIAPIPVTHYQSDTPSVSCSKSRVDFFDILFMMDWIPGLSQLKSGVQLLTGDVDGAVETQKNFARECPGVSQITSVGQLIAGDVEGAKETQRRCVSAVNNTANSLPVVGHVKGMAHHALGDHEGGKEAIDKATRNTVAIGAGATAVVKTATVGAVAAGIDAAKKAQSTAPKPPPDVKMDN